MDPKLAEIYGTNQVDETDVEKLAAAELAEQLSEEEETDLDNVSDEDLEALAQEVLEGSGEEEGENEEGSEEEEGENEEPSEENVEKVAEADYLGRVMAHSFAQETRKIEKLAGMTSGARHAAKAKDVGGKVMGHLKSFGGKAKDIATGKQAREGFKGYQKSKATAGAARNMGKKGVMSEKGKARAGAIAAKHEGAAQAHKRSGLRGAAKTTGLFAAGGAAAYGGKKALEKKSSAIDQLALQRAYEVAAENGVDLDEVIESLQSQEQEKTASPVERLQSEVDNRALAILTELGLVETEENQEE